MSNHNELLASQRVLSMLESACEYSEQILDNIPSVFVVLNAQNRIIRANKAFCDLVGCTLETALHLDFTSFFTSENRGMLLHHVNHLRSNEGAELKAAAKIEFGGASNEVPVKPFFWRIFRMAQISEADGQIISIIGDDLSGLYQSELKLMSIFASIPLGLMVIDQGARVAEVLSDYCHVLLSRHTLVGEALDEILISHNEEQRQDIKQAFDVLRGSTGKFITHFTQREALFEKIGQLKINDGQGGERWIKPRFQPIVKNDIVERYMVILEDITASYLAQKQIEKADMLGKQAQALYECAIRDPLSGLYTRLFMQDSVTRLVASAKRGNFRELALVLFDLDNFKKVNDTYGHDAGDAVIKAFGRVIRDCTRETDVCVRYGGEEFLIALPCNDEPGLSGEVVAERIRAKLAETAVDIGSGRTLNVTTSCGVALCRRDDTVESLIARADKFLYFAKHNGKNRVCLETSDDGENNASDSGG